MLLYLFPQCCGLVLQYFERRSAQRKVLNIFECQILSSMTTLIYFYHNLRLNITAKLYHLTGQYKPIIQYWMRTGLVLLCGFSLGVQCVQVRRHSAQHGWSLTTVSPECCQSKGGKLCGKVVVDCCQKGCQTGYFDSEWCQDDQSFNPPDCNTCMNVCRAKGGKVCDTNILTGMTIECCKAEDCVGGGLDASCKPNTSIDLGKCDRDSIISLAQQQVY